MRQGYVIRHSLYICIADWIAIVQRRQASLDQSSMRENARQIDFDYAIGHRIMIQKDGNIRKTEENI